MIIWCGENRMRSYCNCPASILDRSRMSLMIVSRCLPPAMNGIEMSGSFPDGMLRIAVEQAGGESRNGVERRADLVAHVREEPALGLISRLPPRASAFPVRPG